MLLFFIGTTFLLGLGCTKASQREEDAKIDIGGIGEMREKKQTEIEEWTQ